MISLVIGELHLHKCSDFHKKKNHWYTIKHNMHHWKGCPRCCTYLMSAQHAWIPSSRMSLHAILQQDECQQFRNCILLKISFLWIHFVKFRSSWLKLKMCLRNLRTALRVLDMNSVSIYSFLFCPVFQAVVEFFKETNSCYV